MMSQHMPIEEMFSQATSRTVEMFSLWADANQKVLRELVDLGASTAKEGMRLYAEMQSSAVEVLRESQSFVQRRQTDMRDAPRDPLVCYQQNVVESVEGAQKAFRLFEGNAQAMTRSAERLQVTAEQAAKEIQATFVQLTGKVKSLYSAV